MASIGLEVAWEIVNRNFFAMVSSSLGWPLANNTAYSVPFLDSSGRASVSAAPAPPS